MTRLLAGPTIAVGAFPLICRSGWMGLDGISSKIYGI